MEEIIKSSMLTKNIEAGHGINIKILDDKILISAQCATRLKEGNFLLESDHINVESGPGIIISSRGKDTLVISCNLKNIEEKVYDLEKSVDKRLETIEKIFTKIIKDAKK